MIIMMIFDNIISQILLKHQSLETFSFSLATDQARVRESKDGKTKVVITSLVIWSSPDCHLDDHNIILRLGRLQPTATTSSTPSWWRWRRRTRRSSRRTRSMESSRWWVNVKIPKKQCQPAKCICYKTTGEWMETKPERSWESRVRGVGKHHRGGPQGDVAKVTLVNILMVTSKI